MTMNADVGITASRLGITDEQAATVERALSYLQGLGSTRFHHGDCVGGDLAGVTIAEKLGYQTVAHPPVEDEFRAYHPSLMVLPRLRYLARNRAIVNAVRYMIACPNGDIEQRHGGTWYTVRYARTTGRHLLVIAPAGVVLEQIGFGS